MKSEIPMERTSRIPQRENNFTMIRILATLFVFAGHMGMILGQAPPLLGGFRLHELGVSILFLISGYLITMSWLSDSNPLRYTIRRFCRLWPPFAVMTLVMVFVTGPLVSDLGRQGYFESWYQTYLQNLRFMIVYAQPGVFTELPIPYVTNGSLWTMPVEAALYVAAPVILTLFRVKNHRKGSFYLMAVLTGAVCGFDLYLRIFCTDAVVVFYGTDMIAAYHLTVLYVIGMLFTYEEVRKYLNVQVACVAMCVLLIAQFSAAPLQYLLMYLILPYAVFSFVFTPGPVFSRMGRRAEPSYGIYLYGFFFQQLVVWLQKKYGINLSYLQALIVSLVPTLAAAYLSYFLIEMPMMRFSRFLIKKLRKK